MKFSLEEIEMARALRDLGLPWQPGPGHYVYDETHLIEQSSPFQERVYFILDLKHFLRRSGTIERLKECMFWLPVWDDARNLLRTMGVEDEQVARILREEAAVENGTELLILYRLIASNLER